MYGYKARYIWLYSSQLWLWHHLFLVKMRCESRAKFNHKVGLVTSKLQQNSQKKRALWLELCSQYLRNGPYLLFQITREIGLYSRDHGLGYIAKIFFVIWLCGYIARKSYFFWLYSHKFLATYRVFQKEWQK